MKRTFVKRTPTLVIILTLRLFGVCDSRDRDTDTDLMIEMSKLR